MVQKDDGFHEKGKIEYQVARDSNQGIDFFISYLDIDNKLGSFNIHVCPKTYTPGERLSRWQMLTRLGFKNTRDCPVYGPRQNGCYYKSITVSRYDVDKTNLKNSRAYKEYKWLVANLADIFNRIREVNDMVEGHGLKFPWPTDDFPYGEFTQVRQEAWIKEWKSSEHTQLDGQVSDAVHRIEEISVIMGVLLTTGEDLEVAVESLLTDLGVEPERQDTIDSTAPIDFKVMLPGIEPRSFAIEVTGSKTGVRHQDQKAHDISTYLRYHRSQKEEKVVLLANTFYELGPDDRKDKLHFSDQVVGPLKAEGVLLMTTVQMYEIWRGVMEGRLSLPEVVEQMYSQVGEFNLTTG